MLCSRLSRDRANDLYIEVMQDKDADALRQLCLEDLFFMLTVACKRKDANRDWLYERCREVEENPNGYIDLWSREHYKSSIITSSLTIQDILNDPEVTFGIFSHTRPIAKGFLEQIKRELEDNSFLKKLFPEILFDEPKNQAPKWSLDGGIIVKRKENPKEATIEAWGLVDGQPTSKHFKVLLYDDVVTEESVTTPEQIAKTTKAWELSDNLGVEGGVKRCVGTFYHFGDTYKQIIKRGAAIPRIYPATVEATWPGTPVLMSKESLALKRISQGPYTFSCQMLMNPVADKAMDFKKEWIRFYNELRNYHDWNFYVLVDPAGAKNKTSDYTAIEVWGLAPDKNYYLIDGVRDRMNLTERTRKVFEFVRRYHPLKVGYEKYGLQSDIEHMKYVMEQENYRFEIVALGGQMSKEGRIRRLVPVCEQGRLWLPHRLIFVDYEQKARDFVREFIEDEYLAFPVSVHDDMLDCASRILDPELEAKFPEEVVEPRGSVTYRSEPDRVQTDYDLFPKRSCA